MDAVLSPEWQFRYFAFDPSWSTDEQMASMRDGSGDSYNIVYATDGTVVRAFCHECNLSPWPRSDGAVAPGILDGFPGELRSVIDEPAFRTEGGPATDLTFCAWWTSAAGAWQAGPINDDGDAVSPLEVVLDETPSAYCRYAAEYFEVDVPPSVVEAALSLRTMTAASCRVLNPSAAPERCLAEMASFGYPGRERRLTTREPDRTDVWLGGTPLVVFRPELCIRASAPPGRPFAPNRWGDRAWRRGPC